jgi:hypothetical protein
MKLSDTSRLKVLLMLDSMPKINCGSGFNEVHIMIKVLVFKEISSRFLMLCRNVLKMLTRPVFTSGGAACPMTNRPSNGFVGMLHQ